MNHNTQRVTRKHKRLITTSRRAESGQAIVLIAMVMVVLIAALGLAIDGGGLFFLWRNAQNAGDAAVLAAAYARCTGGDITTAGLQAALANGFNNDGVSNTVYINNPPADGEGAGNSNYVQVKISADKPPFFIQLVYKGPLEVTTDSVAYCTEAFDPTTIPAVVALADVGECSIKTLDWTGAEVTINGGIHSNDTIKIGGGGQGNTINGDSSYVGDIQSNNTTWSPSQPSSPSDPIEDPLNWKIDDYAPGGKVASAVGLYTSIQSAADDPDYKSNGTWKPSNGRVLEGLYYINGDADIGTNVVVDGDRNSDGQEEGLTIVATGKITFNAGSGMDVRYYVNGLIAFTNGSAGCSSNIMQVSGSNANWFGVIYAPNGAAQVSLSSITMVGAIITYTMNMSGSDLELTYDPNILPPQPPNIHITQ